MQWNFTAAIAAWLVPGLGHMMLGHLKRGLILMLTIGTLWLGGLSIGGISVIDRQHHPFWFLGQMLVAPSLAVDLVHRNLEEPLPGNDPSYRPSLGQVHEQGTLYTALAGLLNLLVILDVLYRDPNTPHERADAVSGGSAR